MHLPSTVTHPRAESRSLLSVRHVGTGRALIMDDEPYLRKLFVKHLSKSGYRVTTATNGHEAIAAIEQSLMEDDEFAIAVFDLSIPGAMGGQESHTFASSVRIYLPSPQAVTLTIRSWQNLSNSGSPPACPSPLRYQRSM